MTDPSDAHDADAELASALLDGEAGEHERARAGDVAGLRDRFAVVAARVGEVPPAPAGLVDDHVSAALAAFDGDEREEATAADVVPLGGPRRWWERVPLGAVAAAAAVVVLVGVLGLARAGDDDTDDTATAALDADDAGDGAVPEAFEADAGTADEGMAAGDAAGGSTLAAGEREAYASYDELAAALAEVAPDTTGSAAGDDTVAAAPTADGGEVAEDAEAAERSSAAGCDAVGAVGVSPELVQLVVPVLVDERLVTAVVHRDGDVRRLSVVDDETCAVVERRAL